MASQPPKVVVLHVVFERRDDGGLRAYCDKVPGFVLSHSNPELVLADVEPSLEVILSAMYDMPVQVRKASEIDEAESPHLPAYLCSPTSYVGLSDCH